MAKFEVVSLAEVKLQKRIPAELMSMVEEFKGQLEELREDQAGRFTVGKSDDAGNIRKAVKLAGELMNKRVRFPFRGEEGSLTFYLEELKRRGRPPKEAATAKPGSRKRGRPRKVAG